MWWRPKFVQYTFLTLGVAACGTMVLVSLMLLPAITNGPANVNFLEKSVCTVDGIEYFDNLCLRNTDLDFSNLEYNPHWETCKLARFNITNSLGIQCTWVFPEFFETEQEAFIAISQNWKIGHKYDCIVDTIKNICYQDQNEVIIYSSVIGCLAFIGCCSWGAYVFLRVKWKRRLRHGRSF